MQIPSSLKMGDQMSHKNKTRDTFIGLFIVMFHTHVHSEAVDWMHLAEDGA
jgi:hypothetical protein